MSDLTLRGEPVLTVIDSHTCGQPTRVVIDGLPVTAGDPVDVRELLRDRHDWVRRTVVLEPRGHRSMFGVALLRPDEPDGPFGVVFMDADTYPDMCGHATIGVATTLLRLGWVAPPADDFTGSFVFGLRTPTGLTQLRATLRDGIPVAIAFQPPLAYYLGAVTLPTPAGGEVAVQVAYGGQWYAFVEAAPFDLTVAPEAIGVLIEQASVVRRQLREALTIEDPRTGAVPEVGNIVWHGPPSRPDADACNVPVSAAGAFDRSPCGTATCARVASLHATGALAIDETFVNEGLMGTIFRGRAIAESSADGLRAIVPEVEGSAWLTGRTQLWADHDDPLGRGFLVGGEPAAPGRPERRASTDPV